MIYYPLSLTDTISIRWSVTEPARLHSHLISPSCDSIHHISPRTPHVRHPKISPREIYFNIKDHKIGGGMFKLGSCHLEIWSWAAWLMDSGRKTHRSLNVVAVLPTRIVYAQSVVKAIHFTHGLLLEIGNDNDHIQWFDALIQTQIQERNGM